MQRIIRSIHWYGLSTSQQEWGSYPDLTKDLHLCMPFYHLFDHTEFAITDFIYVRDFYSEIKVEIVKGRD